MERRNTAELVRDREKGLVTYRTWTISYIGITFLMSFLILGHILPVWWVFPVFGLGLAWCGATAHGFRHGWLK